MSGLLDKAKAKEEESIQVEVVAEIDDKGIQSLTEAAGLAEKEQDDGGLSEDLVKVTKGAGIVLALAAVYMVWNLKTIEGIYALGALVISYVLFNLDNILATETNSTKLMAMGVVWLMIGAVPYAIGFSMGDGNVTISSYEFDEMDDKISYQVFSSGGDEFETWITFGEEKVWSETITLTEDKKTVNVDLDEFYQGNSLDYRGKEIKLYSIHVEGDGVSDEFVIEDELAWDLTRTIDTVGLSIIEEVITKANENTGDPETSYYGLAIEILPGLGSNKEFTSTDGMYEGNSVRAVKSDYIMDVEVIGPEKSWSHSEIAVDGDSAVWDGGSGNPYNGWMLLSGTDDGEVREYIHRDKLYPGQDGEGDGDGCYNFKVTLTSDVDGSILVDDHVSYYLSWYQNESDDDNTNDVAPYAC